MDIIYIEHYCVFNFAIILIDIYVIFTYFPKISIDTLEKMLVGGELLMLALLFYVKFINFTLSNKYHIFIFIFIILLSKHLFAIIIVYICKIFLKNENDSDDKKNNDIDSNETIYNDDLYEKLL